MPTSYGPQTTATINLDGLNAGSVAVSNAIDNTGDKYDSIQVILKVKPGELRKNAYILVGIQGSMDNVTFSDSSAQEIKLKSQDGNLQSNVSAQHLMTLSNLPQYYKIYVHNRTGHALSNVAGDNSLVYCGVSS